MNHIEFNPDLAANAQDTRRANGEKLAKGNKVQHLLATVGLIAAIKAGPHLQPLDTTGNLALGVVGGSAVGIVVIGEANAWSCRRRVRSYSERISSADTSLTTSELPDPRQVREWTFSDDKLTEVARFKPELDDLTPRVWGVVRSAGSLVTNVSMMTGLNTITHPSLPPIVRNTYVIGFMAAAAGGILYGMATEHQTAGLSAAYNNQLENLNEIPMLADGSDPTV